MSADFSLQDDAKRSRRVCLRFGGENGVQCYTFQAASHSDHVAWTTALIQATLYAAKVSYT
jgi:hypothetical protein